MHSRGNFQGRFFISSQAFFLLLVAIIRVSATNYKTKFINNKRKEFTMSKDFIGFTLNESASSCTAGKAGPTYETMALEEHW